MTADDIYNGDMEEDEKKFKWPVIKITASFWMGVIETALLTPAAVFWSAIAMYTTLGTDYVYDVVLPQLEQSFWGNALVTLLVIGFPAITIATSGMEYIKTKKGGYRWGIGLGAAFLMLGFYAALKKY